MGFHGNKILRTLVGDVIRLAGATSFVEVGPGSVLQGLIKKINRDVFAEAATF